MIAADRIEPDSIEAAVKRLRRFMEVNEGERPLAEAREAVGRLAESVGLDHEGRELLIRRYRQGWPEHPEKAGTILVGFLLGLMAVQEQRDSGDTLGVTDDDLARWLADG